MPRAGVGRGPQLRRRAGSAAREQRPGRGRLLTLSGLGAPLLEAAPAEVPSEALLRELQGSLQRLITNGCRQAQREPEAVELRRKLQMLRQCTSPWQLVKTTGHRIGVEAAVTIGQRSRCQHTSTGQETLLQTLQLLIQLRGTLGRARAAAPPLQTHLAADAEDHCRHHHFSERHQLIFRLS